MVVRGAPEGGLKRARKRLDSGFSALVWVELGHLCRQKLVFDRSCQRDPSAAREAMSSANYSSQSERVTSIASASRGLD